MSVLRRSLARSGAQTLTRDWRRPGPDAAGRRVDVLVGLGATVLSLAVVELSHSAGLLTYGPQRSTAEVLAWAAAVALPLTVRRTFPLTVLCLCSAVFLVSGLRAPAVGGTFLVQVCFFAALYTAAAWGRDRRRTTGLFGVVALVMFAWLALVIANDGVGDAVADAPRLGPVPPQTAAVLLTLVINVVYFVGAWMIGTAAWRAALLREELRLQTHRLEQEQATSARRAVDADRVRIARELHDVVAHHVSVIGVQAAGARRTLDRDPGAARAALLAVEDSSRAAVGEMRALLGVLRSGDDEPGGDDPAGAAPDGTGEDGAGGNETEADGAGEGGAGEDDVGGREASRAPQPGVAQLPELVTRQRSRGLDVTWAVVGPVVDLPPTISLSLYRTVQEALSNVHRHSTARTAHVTLRYLDGGPAADREDGGGAADGPVGVDGHVGEGRPAREGTVRGVEVEVIDDGRPSGAPPGSALGHTGMRERAALYGGTVDVGPRPVGGYRVRMRFPLTPARAVAR